LLAASFGSTTSSKESNPDDSDPRARPDADPFSQFVDLDQPIPSELLRELAISSCEGDISLEAGLPLA
jgi:hypothetical protein